MQEEGTRTCLIISLANILHYSNCRHHAALLHHKRFKFEDSSGLWKELNAYLLSMSPLLYNKGIKLKFEDLSRNYYYNPLITNVKGSDGKKDHSIGIYNGMIFDSNVEYPMKFSLDALSLCCSDGNKKFEFVGFHQTHQFTKYEDYVSKYSQGDKVQIKKSKRNMKNSLRWEKKKQRAMEEQKTCLPTQLE